MSSASHGTSDISVPFQQETYQDAGHQPGTETDKDRLRRPLSDHFLCFFVSTTHIFDGFFGALLDRFGRVLHALPHSIGHAPGGGSTAGTEFLEIALNCRAGNAGFSLN